MHCTVRAVEIFPPGDSGLQDSCSLHHFALISDYSFICLAIELRLLFFDCNLHVIHLVIVLCLAFRDCDSLVFCHAIVFCLAFRNCDSLGSWLAIGIGFLFSTLR